MAEMIGLRQRAAGLLWAVGLASLGCQVPEPRRAPAALDAIPLRDAMARSAVQKGLQRVRDPLPAVPRPGVLRSATLLVGDLPRIEPATVSSADLRALTLDRGRPSVSGYLLRLQDGQSTQFADGPLLPSGPCPDWDPREGLRWEGIRLDGWTAEELSFEAYAGVALGCKVAAKRASRVRARALVPSLLYAFRSCKADCSPDDPQELHVLGPGARWLSHSDPDLAAQTERHTGLFSHVSVPMGRGQTSSLVLNVDYGSLHDFVGRHRAVPDWEPDQRLLGPSRFAQVQIDVVWLAGDPEPSSQAYLLGDGPSVMTFLASRGVGLP